MEHWRRLLLPRIITEHNAKDKEVLSPQYSYETLWVELETFLSISYKQAASAYIQPVAPRLQKERFARKKVMYPSSHESDL